MRPASLIVILRESFRLELWRRGPLRRKFSRVKTYPIAVGAEGYATPAGCYVVQRKARNPDWYAPFSDWVPEEMRGKVIPGGDPANPILARFLELWGGVGIHGTADLNSLGTRASHGCIRMRPADVIHLYSRTPKGTPVVVI